MLKIVRALVIKELIQTFRDKKLRIVIFLMPVLQTILFGVAVNNEVKNLPVTICDQDRSSLSRELASTLTRGGYFVIAATTSSLRETDEDLMMNRSRAAVVIPPGFERRIKAGRRSPIQLLMDGSDGNTASIALGYLLRMLQDLQEEARIVPVLYAVRGGAPPPAFGNPGLRLRVWYNPQMESSHFMIPGVITMILTVITTLLTAMGITREREMGTFEQLIVSPIRGWELMLGKTLPYALIGFFDAILVTLVSLFLFRIPLNGPVPLLALLNLLYVLAMLGMGLFISTVSSSQQQAMMTVFAVLFPGVILSDFFFPLENMPDLIRIITYFNPMRYGMHAQREIFLKGAGWRESAHSLLILAAFGFSFLTLGSLRFRKKIST